MAVHKCSQEGMIWWVSAALASEGLPVAQPVYQQMIRKLVTHTYSAGGWLAVEPGSPMQNIMITHGPKSAPMRSLPVTNAQGMPLGPNSVPPAIRQAPPVLAPQTAPAAQMPPNPGLIQNPPGREVPVNAPMMGDAPPSMTLEPEIEF